MGKTINSISDTRVRVRADFASWAARMVSPVSNADIALFPFDKAMIAHNVLKMLQQHSKLPTIKIMAKVLQVSGGMTMCCWDTDGVDCWGCSY